MNRNDRQVISSRIFNSLSDDVKSYDLPSECSQLGMADGDESEAFLSKKNYVKRRLEEVNDATLLTIAFAYEEKYPDFAFREVLKKIRDALSGPEVSDLTRRLILNELGRYELFGEYHKIVDELETIFPLSEMTSQWGGTVKSALIQHCIRNQDLSNDHVFEEIKVISCSRSLFFEFLEKVVHPNSRRNAEQQEVVDTINPHLKKDGYHLIQSGSISGYPLFKIVPLAGGVAGSPKNLIFAADGAKPELVLTDAINNDIQIVKNADKCLVYDRPISSSGLTKQEMLEWWQDLQKIDDNAQARKSLVERLKRSLASDGERNLFAVYYKTFKATGDNFPALIPQVYLHYDPYTIKQLGGLNRLVRQRMDFLILFSAKDRVVIEVDGSQHFAENGEPSLRKYADMVEADRDLRLAGYEIYRFGSNELVGAGSETKIQDFFTRLMRKHGL